jgi:protein-tyrosine-phosphatase
VLLFRSFDPALDRDDRYDGQVPDPYGGSPEDYAVAYGLVRAAVRGLTGQLAGLLQAPAAEPGGR